MPFVKCRYVGQNVFSHPAVINISQNLRFITENDLFLIPEEALIQLLYDSSNQRIDQTSIQIVQTTEELAKDANDIAKQSNQYAQIALWISGVSILVSLIGLLYGEQLLITIGK